MILIKFLGIAIVTILLFTCLLVTILISAFVLAEVIGGLFKKDEKM